MSGTVAAPLAHGVKKNATMMMILGIVIVVFGLLAIMAPMMTGITVAVMVGFLLIAAGVLRTFYAFKAQTWGKGILRFLLGLLTLVAGLFMVIRPLTGVLSLTLLLAAYFFVDGICEIMEAFQIKPLHGWGWMLFGGIVSVLLAFMIWRQWPFSGAWAIGILVGVKLLFAGFGLTAIGAAGRGIAGRAEDAIETVKEKLSD